MADFDAFHKARKYKGGSLSKKLLGNRVLEYLTWIVEKSKTQQSSHRAPGEPMSYRALETYRADLRAMIKYKAAPPFTKVSSSASKTIPTLTSPLFRVGRDDAV